MHSKYVHPLGPSTNKILEKVRNLFPLNTVKLKKVFLEVTYKDKKIPARIDYMDCDAKDLQNKFWIILTHGAGGDLNTPQLSALATFLEKFDFVVFRFTCKGLNVKYRIKVYAEVLKFVCNSYNPEGMFVGGRSMGARAAVMLTEKDVDMKIYEQILGIICLSYPLHKVNCTTDLRSGPLKLCKKPIFFLSGTQDEMCNKELFENVLLDLKAPYKIQWLHDYDHSAKSKNNFEEDAYTSAFQALVNWCKVISNKS